MDDRSSGDLRIRDAGELEAALAAERFLLFKHSFRCPISTRAFEEYRAILAQLGDEAIATGWIDVVGGRPVSMAASERTGVRHESPQALLLARGAVVWHASHGAITRASLTAAVRGG